MKLQCSSRQICTDYGECAISNEAYDILISHGMDISKFIDEDFEDDDNTECMRNITNFKHCLII